jgi:hypothetical protein
MELGNTLNVDQFVVWERTASESIKSPLLLPLNYFCPRKLMAQKAKSIAINKITGHAHGYGFPSSIAWPVSKSTGTEFWWCTISHLPLIFRQHAVQRSHRSVLCPLFMVPLIRLRL